MNLYLLSQNVNIGYDTYDSLVVSAETEDEARFISPSHYKDEPWDGECTPWGGSWCGAKDVIVKLIGVAEPDIEKGKILIASFNAG